MEIKKLANISLNFIIKRFIELFGLVIFVISIFLLISLISYSPEDPNFIFPENTEIQNILGFKGSFTSDLFFQSLGLISMFISISLFFTSINIIRSKQIFLLITNLFYTILYSLLGALFFSVFYPNSFWLSINGNGGFVGKFLEKTFLASLINLNQEISYYILIIIILLLFLISINFKLNSCVNYIKILFKFLFKKKEKNLINNEKNINPITETIEPIQEDLPFIKNTLEAKTTKSKFILPSINLLKLPTKKERQKSLDEDGIDPNFLEKILLDFGVEGKIKKISHGPVVTLNEFEPAAGIKVSKIINLSEDIARNTSSESARISTIPGSNTIGIELPNSSRENVYLSEIISHNDFFKKDIKLPIALGKNISGVPITGDLSSMPHLLIAGTTGSGKSICINTIILSLLYRHPPDRCKFILIDPKMLELSTYEDIPHLLCPVITEAKKATAALGWAVTHQLPIVFICEYNDFAVLTKTEDRRSWKAVDLANSLDMYAIDITDDPWLIAYHVKKISESGKPGFINIRTVRGIWHAGTGVDENSEWNRYQLVVDELVSMGLSEEIKKKDIGFITTKKGIC